MFIALTIPARLKALGALVFTAGKEWVSDRCGMLAAAMSYNLLLEIAPLVGATLWLAGRAFGSERTQTTIYPILLAWLGPRWEAMLRFLLVRTTSMEPEGLFAVGVLGALGLVLGASAFFLQMQDALETVWDVRRQEASLGKQFKKKIFGLGYAAVSALIALAGTLIGTAIYTVSHWIQSERAAAGIWWVGGEVAAFLTFWALMAFWLKTLIPVRLRWRQVMPWAALTAVLHMAGVQILHWVVRNDPSTSLVESLISLLFWFYYVSGVFLFGAELMRVSLQRHGPITRKK